MVRQMSARVQRIWYARIVKCALCFTGVLMAAVSYATESPYASGGNVTTFLSADGLYNIYVHTFTNASAVEMFRNLGKRTLSLRYLVVGAGGAGAWQPSGRTTMSSDSSQASSSERIQAKFSSSSAAVGPKRYWMMRAFIAE